jgi:Bacteriophage tail sheath protein
MPTSQVPGVYRTDLFPSPAVPLRTAVPVFLGLATDGPIGSAERINLWTQFGERFGGSPTAGFLADAVQGFFANGGEICRVVRLDETVDPVVALEAGLEATVTLDDVDLVCLPDASRLREPGELPTLEHDPDRVRALQRAVIDHCELVGTRVAILDSLPNAGQLAVLEQRRALTSADATLYYPWVLVQHDAGKPPVFVPPCGHVAGIYATTDRAVGVHKAPANEVVHGALDLEIEITDDLQAALNPVGVNCLRAFPGRGIRVWGARTLSTEAAWTYVNVRRLILTAARWVAANMTDVLFEPNDEALWGRVRRELIAYFTELHRQGALKGATPEEGFFVRCDADTNAGQEPGHVVAQVGLAPSLPNEFIVVYVVHEAGGVSVVGPSGST